MKTLQIDEKNAKKLYPTASAEFKATLEDTFGKEFFSHKITDRVKSFEDACVILGINSRTVLPELPTTYLNNDLRSIQAYAKLTVIIRALNEGWTPDWDNSDEPKYYCWFEKKKSGFVLNLVLYHCTVTPVGSRLCFKSRELAQYAGEQFQSIYNDFLTV